MKADSLSTGEKKVLKVLAEEPSETPEKILDKGGFRELVEVMNAASWLQSKGLVKIEERVHHKVSLDDEGRYFIEHGFPERRALKMMADSSKGYITMDGLKEAMGKGVAGITIGWLMRKGWAEKATTDDGPALMMTEAGKMAVDAVAPDEDVLQFIFEMEEVEVSDIADLDALDQLKRRKNVVKVKDEVVRTVTITPEGREVVTAGIEIRGEATQLTPSMLRDGKWRDMSFRPYDVDTFAPRATGGKLNPQRNITEEIRQTFLAMGFTEVDYDFIQPCFWNMDALFIPQDHAARDLQDTFYMKDPEMLKADDKVVDVVRAVHEDGGNTGSTGWGYKWSREDSERVVLRTHTTVNSIRYLAQHPEPPVKMFTIGRVFRNEQLTYKHLPEFQQIEGIVMEEGASFRMLLGLLREFYRRMGFEDIRIRPSFFPYTEPSLEVDAKFQGEWMEMGGSGIFRPEVTEPFGIKHPVLAWGLGLERLLMIRYKVDDIRSLYINDIDWLNNAPLL
jgi:phenylalanyl-tRNA synthetase alpha chain